LNCLADFYFWQYRRIKKNAATNNAYTASGAMRPACVYADRSLSLTKKNKTSKT